MMREERERSDLGDEWQIRASQMENSLSNDSPCCYQEINLIVTDANDIPN